MVRVEDKVVNYTAGIDLANLFFHKYKYNTEIMIFCTDVVKAKENSKKSNLDKKRLRITNKIDELYDFV